MNISNRHAPNSNRITRVAPLLPSSPLKVLGFDAAYFLLRVTFIIEDTSPSSQTYLRSPAALAALYGPALICSHVAADAQNELPEFVRGLRAAAQHIARLGHATAGEGLLRPEALEASEALAASRSRRLLPLEGGGALRGDSAS